MPALPGMLSSTLIRRKQPCSAALVSVTASAIVYLFISWSGPYGVRWSIDEIQRASKKAEDGGKEIVYGKLHRLAEHKGETIPDHNSMYSDEGAVDLISTSLKVVKLFKD